jgi:uncharacterized protein (TIGR00725 family)
MPRTHRGPREISVKPPISRGSRYVAVCGASEATPSQLHAAREVGRLLAESGAIVINGGMGGVSGAASEGAASAGGMVVGILADMDRQGANPHLTISLPTGMGQARNVLIVTAAESVIAIGEGWGTLSEIAIARRLGRSVTALDSWSVNGLESVNTPAEAVKRALEN